jgi:hypothetical protein
MYCDNCYKSFNDTPIENQWRVPNANSYYNVGNVTIKFCSRFCENEYCKFRRCNTCSSCVNLGIHNSLAYCNSSKYLVPSCLQQVKIAENNVKCLMCKDDVLSLPYKFINDTTIICYDCCNKFNFLFKFLNINVIDDVHDLYKCAVCRHYDNETIRLELLALASNRIPHPDIPFWFVCSECCKDPNNWGGCTCKNDTYEILLCPNCSLIYNHITSRPSKH